MKFDFESFTHVGKNHLESLAHLSHQTLNGIEQVVELSIESSRALILDGQNHLNSAFQAKDPQQLLQAQSNYFQPLTEKFISYNQSLYQITSAAQKEIYKTFENAFAGLQAGVAEAVDKAGQNAPKGTEAGFLALKTITNASQSTLDTVQRVVKQANEVTENGVNTVLNATSNAVKSAQKRAQTN
ncbi:MAG: phasin family protein [Gammaproteobacteria bacterium]|nr:phasin family protein [Gammaproteobacteria bacterium]